MSSLVNYIERFYSGASLEEVDLPPFDNRESRIQKGNKRLDFSLENRAFELRSSENFTNFDRRLIDTARDRVESVSSGIEDESLVSALVESVFDNLVIENFFFYGRESIDPDEFQIYRGLLSTLVFWKNKTYENRGVSFGLVVDLEDDNGSFNYEPGDLSVLRNDYMAPLSDGMTTFLKLNRYGEVRAIEQIDHFTDSSDLPYRFSTGREFGTGKVMVLTRAGDILLMSEDRLRYVKKAHQWIYYNSTKLSQRLCGNLRIRDPELRKAIYSTCLDVSLAKTGAVIGVVTRSDFDMRQLVSSEILNNRDYQLKIRTLDQLIGGRRFQDLERAVRKELASIDGSLIMTTTGEILGVGTIVKIEGGSLGGGRTAAAIILSEHGAGIKVSSDGYISLYRGGEKHPIMRIE